MKLLKFKDFLVESAKSAELFAIDEASANVTKAIGFIRDGAGWAADEYLHQMGGPMGLKPKEMMELAIELAKKGMLYSEDGLSDNAIENGDLSDEDEKAKMSVAQAKKMVFESTVNELVRVILDKDIEDDLYDNHGQFFDGPAVDDYSGNEMMVGNMAAAEKYLKANKIKYKIQESVNEAEKVDGVEMGGETDKSMFGKVVKSFKDLKIDNEYILMDLGMNEWLGNFEYTGTDPKGKTHIFSSTLQFNDFQLDYTKDELEEAIANKEIYNQI